MSWEQLKRYNSEDYSAHSLNYIFLCHKKLLPLKDLLTEERVTVFSLNFTLHYDTTQVEVKSRQPFNKTTLRSTVTSKTTCTRVNVTKYYPHLLMARVTTTQKLNKQKKSLS